jgi:predicted enzyme related to lactoylglutathione lyase
MADSRTYPHGVPSWIETEQPDPAAARAFYGELFGWAFEDRPGGYTIARLAGRDAAGLIQAGIQPGGAESLKGAAGWTTYVAVDDADTVVKRIHDAGGQILAEPQDIGRAGRAALCTDPLGARFGLWQAGIRLGVQAVNEPGAWNFSNLHTPDPQASAGFYATAFGWSVDDVGFGRMIRVPGYGDHLASTIDPTIHERQSAVSAPPGFADAVAWLIPERAGSHVTSAQWKVVFTVADRDATTAAAERLGGIVVAAEDSQWTCTAVIRDPWGAEFTASQFTPPS